MLCEMVRFMTLLKVMAVNKYDTYRLVSEGSGGGNPIPET